MNRDIKKCIEEYDHKYSKTNDSTTRGAFYLSDYYQIVEISQNPMHVVFNALKVGFIIGYRAAKRDSRKKAA